MNYVEHVRLLACTFEIRTNSLEFLTRFATFVPRAEQAFPVLCSDVVTVTWADDEYRIVGGDAEDDFELDAGWAVEAVCRRLYRRAANLLPEHVFLIGCICVAVEGLNCLIIGSRRSGKSTLAVALTLRGCDVTGDDLVLLRDGETVAWPRRFLLPEESVPRLPQLSGVQKRFSTIAALPRVAVTASTDPADLGRPWRIRSQPTKAIIYLKPKFDTHSSLRSGSMQEMLGLVIPHCAPPISGRKDWLLDVCRTIDGAATYVLELGDVAGGCDALAEVLSG